MLLRLDIEFSNDINHGMGLEPEPSPAMMYVVAFNNHIANNDLNMQFLISLFIIFGFFRILMSLKVS